MRVGGREPVPMRARIIAVSEPTLADAVAEGRFREDLYYRLNVVPIDLPPLRERSEDVPALVEFFVRKYAEANQTRPPGVASDAILGAEGGAGAGSVIRRRLRT